MTEDAELLRRYAVCGDEAAFRQVVEHNLSIVYASALRQVGGDHGLAEEVTQNVFNDLARHAGEFGRESLVGRWLCRATRFAAAHAVRSEHRRRMRESAYAKEMVASPATALPAGGESTPWDQARAHLDDAVNALHEQDRDAILLRYFQGLDLGAVGAALRTSGNTAHKRISRALEKLRLLLAQRGVALSVTALAAFLSQEAAAAAPPPGLIDAIAREISESTAAGAGAGVSGAGDATGFSASTSQGLSLPMAAGLGAAAAVVLGLALAFALGRSTRSAEAGLVSWWTGDGHAGDASGHNPAHVRGNVTFAPGMSGQAFHFDGTEGTCLEVADALSLNLTNEITLACWFRPDADSNMGSLLAKRNLDPSAVATGGSANYGLQLSTIDAVHPQWGICSYFNDPSVAGGYHLVQNALATNYVVSRRNLNEQLAFFPAAVQDLGVLRGQWHHLAATFRQRAGSIEVTAWLNGSFRGRKEIPGSLSRALTDAPLTIGGLPYSWFKGCMDDIRIYDRVLLEHELRHLAINPSQPQQQAAR